ncbi:MAG: sigma-70 family RNA polymerase sigma factor [Tenericutes bacterium]|nr:sigma-70 family RNA polymerase sigma factor [Mycoplasmatota bacterium]
MNDYELIYLIRVEQDETALDFLFKKYHKLIWKYVHLLGVEEKEHDDLHQEGVLMLHKAIKTFDESKNKSFTRYFELILRRHLIHAKRKLPSYYLYEHTDFIKGASYIEDEQRFVPLHSELEQIVYNQYFLLNQSVTSICNATNYSKKQIYNTIFRIKEKYKNMI